MPHNLIRKDGEWFLFSARDIAGTLKPLHDVSRG
jgi:hypothetical protein